ncbi:hypothetical protein ACLOJK_026065 [Asimina triloba]
MGKKTRSALTSRAWNLLRLALFWARKGGIFKRTAMLDFLKSLRPAHRGGSVNYYGWGEREFSFDETPMFQFKPHRSSASMRFPRIPCINPSSVAVDDDEEDGEMMISSRSSEFYDDHLEFDCESSGCIDDLEGEDEGIDSKAEEFIARFYEQMKLQRQISYLEYTEMLQRSVN